MIIALGAVFAILTAGADLSAGKMVGLAAVVSASMLQLPDYLRLFLSGPSSAAGIYSDPDSYCRLHAFRPSQRFYRGKIRSASFYSYVRHNGHDPWNKLDIFQYAP